MIDRRSLSCFALFVLGAILSAVLYGQSSSFGNPAKAEFYAVQTNPESSDGTFVPRPGAGGVVFLQPSRLLGASDIASIYTAPSNPGSSVWTVSFLLTSSAVARINALIAASSPDAPIALVWQGQVLYQYAASTLVVSGPILIADQLSQTDANNLGSALQ
jgi:preprotein translocase subunit SecD